MLVLLFAVTNYFAFLEILENCLVAPLESYLHSLGYLFSIKEPFSLIGKFLPGVPVLTFVSKLNNDDEFRSRAKDFYSSIQTLQLLILSFLLPGLLLIQNKFYGDVKETNSLGN